MVRVFFRVDYGHGLVDFCVFRALALYMRIKTLFYVFRYTRVEMAVFAQQHIHIPRPLAEFAHHRTPFTKPAKI